MTVQRSAERRPAYCKPTLAHTLWMPCIAAMIFLKSEPQPRQSAIHPRQEPGLYCALTGLGLDALFGEAHSASTYKVFITSVQEPACSVMDDAMRIAELSWTISGTGSQPRLCCTYVNSVHKG